LFFIEKSIMLRKIILVAACYLLITSPAFANLGFTASEHVLMGNEINLFFSNDVDGKKASLLHLPSGLNATYGDIIALGDFYGTVGQPISLEKTTAKQNELFIAAFNAFANDTSNISEAEKILAIIHNEEKAVEDGVQQGKAPEEIYKQISAENNRQYNCITGGGCGNKTWWLNQGRYLKLANENFDHFGDNAWVTYRIGHALALQTALIARKSQDLNKLELAYAMNAFACHFLSDHFAAGHIRTPRNELTAQVTPKTVASILARYMHDEENAIGIHLHNKKNQNWIAYGDQSYLNPKNAVNRLILLKALQISANEIFTAYQQGFMPLNDEVYALLPEPDETENAAKQDISALFYFDPKANYVMRRVDTENYYDRHWTASWWGWSTLVLLNHQRGGIPVEEQAQLVADGLGKAALRDGLITDPTIAAYVRKQN